MLILCLLNWDLNLSFVLTEVFFGPLVPVLRNHMGAHLPQIIKYWTIGKSQVTQEAGLQVSPLKILVLKV